MQYLGATSKMAEWLFSFPKQTIQNHSNPSLCPYHRCWRSWSWSVLWRPRRPPRTNIRKKEKRGVLLIIGDWNVKVGSQEIPWITGKFGLGEQNESGQSLSEFCQENTVVKANVFVSNTEMTLCMDITKWSIQKSNQLCSL